MDGADFGLFLLYQFLYKLIGILGVVIVEAFLNICELFLYPGLFGFAHFLPDCWLICIFCFPFLRVLVPFQLSSDITLVQDLIRDPRLGSTEASPNGCCLVYDGHRVAYKYSILDGSVD